MSLFILDSQGQWSKSHWPRIHCVICFPSGLTINITIQYFLTPFKIKQFRRQPAFTSTVTVQDHQAFATRPAKSWVFSALKCQRILGVSPESSLINSWNLSPLAVCLLSSFLATCTRFEIAVVQYFCFAAVSPRERSSSGRRCWLDVTF